MAKKPYINFQVKIEGLGVVNQFAYTESDAISLVFLKFNDKQADKSKYKAKAPFISLS